MDEKASRYGADLDAAAQVDEAAKERTADLDLKDLADQAQAEETLAQAEVRALEIIAAAHAEADEIIEAAERRARERSDVVIAQTQERLDALLAQERQIRSRLDTYRPTVVPMPEPEQVEDSRDAVHGIEVAPDSSLADFMKSTLRHELRPE